MTTGPLVLLAILFLALAAGVAPGSAAENGPTIDFESGDLSTSTGAGWFMSTDQAIGGTSTVDLQVIDEGAQGSRHSLAIVGNLTLDSEINWAGGMFSPGPSRLAPVDLSSQDYITFWAKGTERTYAILLSFPRQEERPVFMNFAAGPEWTRHLFPLEEFGGMDGHDIAGVFLGASGSPGPFRLLIDDLEFRKAPPPGRSGPRPFVVDGRFEEWEGMAPIFERAPGERTGDALAVDAVWATSDRDRLHLRVKLSDVVSLQSNSGIVLQVDGDGRPDTGIPVDDLGAEFLWSFSDRTGQVWQGDGPVEVTQSSVDLRQAPTLSASEFEISLDRRSAGIGDPFFHDTPIAIRIRVESIRSGDVLNSTGRLEFKLGHALPGRIPEASPDRGNPEEVRVLTYNVLLDGLFERSGPFTRILRAMDPDVVLLQEIYEHSTAQTRDWIATALPDRTWHATGFGGNVVLSRFPVLDSGPVGPGPGAWALLDLPHRPALVVNLHPPCCHDDDGRQQVFDALAAWIRDSRASGRVSPAAPVIVAGDMNLVGNPRQLSTLLGGAIVDTVTHGRAAPPDGDGTAFADAAPYHLTGTETYTWRDDGSRYGPGRLDYIVYSDSALDLARTFILWTPDLAPVTLERLGLEREDTVVASDHLPVVADFRVRPVEEPR